MYSSLHKIDIVAKTEQGPLCVQTDHRDRAEIEAQREISIVFGVTRMLAPALADTTHQQVQYVCMGEPPPFLRELVRLCGATLSENGEKSPREPARPKDVAAVERISHDALMSLGRAVFARHGLEATPEGLERLEEIVRDGEELDVEENEIAYYEALVELAAAGGVAIVGKVPNARWCMTPQVMSMVPLAIDIGNGHLTNVFGRTERFFEGDVDRGPSALLEMTEQRPDAPVVGILKPAAWGRGNPFPPLSEPLIGGKDVPILAYAHDHPRAVAYINVKDGMPLDEAREKAQAFYKTIKANVERLSSDLPIWLVTGDYYAPEKMLDREFARELHVRLEAETLLVALPARGTAAFVPVRTDPREASIIIASFIKRAQERVPPGERISDLPFIMMKGEICGYVSIDAPSDAPSGLEGIAPEPAPKKGFWRRLFGN
jgi:hypothetical protein